MKKIRLLSLIFAVLFALSSCTRFDWNLPTEETTAAETKSEPEREPVESVPAPDWKGPILAIFADGQGHAVVQIGSDETQGYLDTGSVLYRVSLDGEKPSAAVSAQTDKSLLGVRKNGEVLVADYETRNVYLLDENLRSVRTLSANEPFYGITFDPESDLFWWQNDGVLRVMDMEGKIRTAYDFGYLMDYRVYDPESEDLVITCAGSNDDTYHSFYFFSGGQKEPLFKGDDDYDSYLFSGGRMIRVRSVWHDPDVGSDEVEWTHHADVFERNGELTVSYDLPFEYLIGSRDHAYAVSTLTVYDDKIPEYEDRRVLSNTVVFADFERGVWGKVPGIPENANSVLFAPVPGSDEFLLGLSWREADHRPELYLVDPARLELDQKLDPHVEKAVEKLALSESLSEARKKADEMEKKYSVRILLGNECLNAEGDGFYEFVSTENSQYGTFYDPVQELLMALKTLDAELERYPKGFFKTFLDPFGDGGARFLFIRELESDDYENFSAAAIEYEKGNWYNVAFDIDELSDTTVHHELWHAVEDRIIKKDYDAFSDWSDLNPDGFDYLQDFDTYDEEDVEEYLLWGGSDPYFARQYSIVTDHEDRATLVEELFDDNYLFIGAEPYENSLEMIAQYPHLQAKLDYMAKWVREVFGTVYWESMVV